MRYQPLLLLVGLALPTHAAIFSWESHIGSASGNPANPGSYNWTYVQTRQHGHFDLRYSAGGPDIYPGALDWNVGLMDEQTIALQADGWKDNIEGFPVGGYLDFQTVMVTTLTDATAFSLSGSSVLSSGAFNVYTVIQPLGAAGFAGVPTSPNGELRVTATGTPTAVALFGTMLPGDYQITVVGRIYYDGSFSTNLQLSIPAPATIGLYIAGLRTRRRRAV